MRYFAMLSDAERRLLLRVGYGQRQMRRYKALGAAGAARYNEWRKRVRRLWKAIDAL